MNNAVYLLQVALKSGKATFGSRLIPAIQKQQVRLVVFSSLIGANQRKKLINKCTTYQIPIVEMEADQFNKISNSANMAFGIEEKNLAEKIFESLKTSQ